MSDYAIFPTAVITPKNTAYSAGQMVGGTFQFNLKAQKIGSLSGLITGVSVMDNDLEGAAGDLFIFGGSITAHADATGFDANISYADMQKRIGRVTLGTFESYTNLKFYNTDNQATPFKPILYRSFDEDGLISGIFKCSGTPTYALAKTLIIMLHMLNER